MSVEEDPSSQSKSGSSAEHLRDVCLEHLTLIHKMSETIQAKDRQIKILRESNNQVKTLIHFYLAVREDHTNEKYYEKQFTLKKALFDIFLS